MCTVYLFPYFPLSGQYVFILQQDNTQNIKPEGQQGSEVLIWNRGNIISKNVATEYFW